MSIWLQKSASIQMRTSPPKFDHFRYRIPHFAASNLSTKVLQARARHRQLGRLERDDHAEYVPRGWSVQPEHQQLGRVARDEYRRDVTESGRGPSAVAS